MQKLAALITFFSICISAQSQSLSVHSYDEFIFVNSMQGDYFHHGATVTNTSHNSVDVRVKRHIYSFCAIDSTHFDWDLCCTPITLNESVGHLTIEPGEDNTAFEAWCFGSMTAVSCTNSVGYTFYNADDPSDSTQIVFKYVAGPDISIDEERLATFSFYPNPANQYIILELGEIEIESDMMIQIYGLKGKLLTEEKVTTNRQHVSTKNLPNGIYFLSIRQGCKALSSQKLHIHK